MLVYQWYTMIVIIILYSVMIFKIETGVTGNYITLNDIYSPSKNVQVVIFAWSNWKFLHPRSNIFQKIVLFRNILNTMLSNICALIILLFIIYNLNFCCTYQ